MTDSTMISGAITSLKAATDIVKVLYAAKIDADTKEKVSQLQQLVWDARELAYNAQDELAEIKKLAAAHEQQVIDMKKWGQDKERYRLFKKDEVRSVVYALKESASLGEPPHYLCHNCYQDGRKSILNNNQSKEGWTVLLCPKCHCTIPTGHRGQVTPVYAPD